MPGKVTVTVMLGVLAMLALLVTTACGGPSDQDVTEAAEKSVSRLLDMASLNIQCLMVEAATGGTASAEVSHKYSAQMKRLTDSLENSTDATNEEKMEVIAEMDALVEEWEAELAAVGCVSTES